MQGNSARIGGIQQRGHQGRLLFPDRKLHQHRPPTSFPIPEPRKPRLNSRPLRPPKNFKGRRRDPYNELGWEKKSKRQRVLYAGTSIPYLEFGPTTPQSSNPSNCDSEARICSHSPIAYSSKHWKPRTLDQYKKQDKIGAGVYGDVYKTVSPNGETVALKHLRIENQTEGLPLTVLREIHVLAKLDHENIIRLYDVVTSDKEGPLSRRQAEIYMVLEWCDHDLAALIKHPDFDLSETAIKHIMTGIMNGCQYLHVTANILHRDLKPANILITKGHVVKLGDFGLSRFFRKGKNLTNENKVVTRFYRAPELLLSEMRYTKAIDIWSLGCVFAEMMQGEPIFQARLDMHQLAVIEDTCGSITDKSWPAARKLNFNATPKLPRQRKVRDRFAAYTKQWDKTNRAQGLDLLDKLLQLDPLKRLKAHQALKHPWFKCRPLAASPTLPAKCSFEYATVRKKKKSRKRGHQRNRGSSKRPHHGSSHSNMWESGNQPENIAQIFSNQFEPKKHRSYRQTPYQQYHQRPQSAYQVPHKQQQLSFQDPYRPDLGGWRSYQSRPSRNFLHQHQQPSKIRHSGTCNLPS